MHFNHFGQKMFYDFGDQHTIREVSRYAPFRSTQWNLINPVVDHLEVFFGQPLWVGFLMLLLVLLHQLLLLLNGHLAVLVVVELGVHFEF